jgi:outer membrane protein assembly factor BamB
LAAKRQDDKEVRRKKIVRTSCFLLLASCVLTAQEWPAFRGPGGQGHSTERHLPIEWSESRNLVWKSPITGSGWSSPVVAGGRVWITAAVENRDVSLRAMAFDVETGREVVNVEVFRLRSLREINPKNSWASPTPIVEGDRVYVHFGADGTAALTTTGEIVWKTRFDYESQHGAGGSPILHGDLLILSCDGHDAAFVVAVDKKTGKVRWKTNRRSPADQAYTTPLAIRVGEQDQVVSVGAFRTTAYDPANGKEIWRVSYADGFSNVPRPVFGQGLVFIATGFQQPALIAVRPDGTGDVTKSHLAWTLQRGAPFTPSPLLVGEELYVLNDGGILTVVNATTGTVVWQMRLGGTFSASPVFADGRIYLSSEQGLTTVIAPGREFRRLASNPLEGSLLASMAVANGSIFLRSDTHVYRIADASKAPAQ